MSEFENKSPAEVKLDLLERTQTEGVVAAFDAALAVLRDPKAAAPAKATMTTTVFRVAGYLKDNKDGFEKDVTEMSRAELDAFVRTGSAQLAQLERSLAEKAAYLDSVEVIDDDDVFG